MQRAHYIQAWLSQVFGGNQFEISYLDGDASFRRYARIRSQQQDYMLMDAPPEKENCQTFVEIAEYLQQHGARVPKIIAQQLSQGLLLLEDFGDQLLANVLRAETVDHYYLQAFKQIIQLQSIPIDAAIIADYSPQKLLEEMRLFEQWLLPDLAIDLDQAQQQQLAQSYQWILANLEQQPQVLVHRDYHSRNLMCLADESPLGIIDFQDAVRGPDSYDLISLIRDAYVQWPKAKVAQWVAEFYALLPEPATASRDFAQFLLDVEVMSIQRHLKILGIFVRLSVRDAKSGYLKDLPRVMWYLRQQLAACSELQALSALIEQVVWPAFVRKYGDYTEVTA
jgi:aminoglycoside/choline kinase family phosphotransferase